jgi:hypothetical protein
MNDTTGTNSKRVPDSSELEGKNTDLDKGSDSDNGNLSTDDDKLTAQGAAHTRAILNAEVCMLHHECKLLMQNVAQRPTFKSSHTATTLFEDNSDDNQVGIGANKARHTTANMSNGLPVAKTTRKPLADIEAPGGQLNSRRQEKHDLEVRAFMLH